MKHSHSQSHIQKPSYKDLRYIVKTKDIHDDGILFTDEYEDEFSESYIQTISSYEINYETYSYEGRSLEDIGTIVKTNKGYRFLFKNPKFEEIDQILKKYFLDFEEITPDKLKGILKKRKKGENKELSLYIPGGNPSNYFIRLPNGNKLHLSWLFRSSGKDTESAIRSCFRLIIGEFKENESLQKINEFLSNKENFEKGVEKYDYYNCKETLLKGFKENFLIELINFMKGEIESENTKQ